MNAVLIGLGSNIQPQKYLLSGLLALQNHFPDLAISPVYESEALGFEGNIFWNLVAVFTTGLSVLQVAELLRDIEYANGRNEYSLKYSNRTLDIDILTFGNFVGKIAGLELPREDILRHSFVLKPLCDLVPEWMHPSLHKSYQALLQEFTIGTPLHRLSLDKQEFFSPFLNKHK